MNIGIVMPTMGVTGGVRRIVEIANRLVEYKHNVTIYNDQKNRAETWLKPMKFLYQQKRLSDILKESNKDVWLCGWPNFESWVYTTIKGKVFYLIQHIEGSWKEHINNKNCSTISFSTYAYNWTVENSNHKNHYKCIGGLNTDIFNCDINKVAHERVQRMNFGNKFVILGYPRKRAKYLVKAVDILNNDSIELRFFGNPKVDDCNKSKYFKGQYYHSRPQNEIPNIYSGADLYVSLQTERACWNNPVAEAMACGCPVVTTDVGAVQDLKCAGLISLPSLKKFKNDENHFIGSLAAKIKDAMWLFRIKVGSSHVNTFIENSYKHVQQFSWNNIFPKFEGIVCGKQ